MDSLIQVLRYEIWALLVGLAGIVAYRMLTGAVRTTGLLYDKSATKPEGGPGLFSPGRLQLLLFTLAGAFYYLMLVYAGERPGEFPPVPWWLLGGLGGSHAFYLGGKTLPLLLRAFAARRGGP